MAHLLPDFILDSRAQTVPSSTIEGCVVGLYFSAGWCPPCRVFTPILAAWYLKFKKAHPQNKLYFVFISSDEDEAQFKLYHSSMPFHALPFEEHQRRDDLHSHFEVTGVPTLVLIGANGQLLSHDASDIIMGDPEGKGKPIHDDIIL